MMALSASSLTNLSSFKEDISSPYAKPLSMLERLSAELDRELRTDTVSFAPSTSSSPVAQHPPIPSSLTRNEQWIPSAAAVHGKGVASSSSLSIQRVPYSLLASNSRSSNNPYDGSATPPRPESLSTRIHNNMSSRSSSNSINGNNPTVPNVPLFSNFTTTQTRPSSPPASSSNVPTHALHSLSPSSSASSAASSSLSHFTSFLVEKNQLHYPTSTIQGNTAAVHSYLVSSSLPPTYTAPLPFSSSSVSHQSSNTTSTATTAGTMTNRKASLTHPKPFSSLISPSPYNTSILSLNTDSRTIRTNDTTTTNGTTDPPSISSVLPKSVPSLPSTATKKLTKASTVTTPSTVTSSSSSVSSFSLLSGTANPSTPSAVVNQEAAEVLKLQLQSLNKRIEQRTRKANPEERKALAMATRLAILEGTTTAVLPSTVEDLGIGSTVTSSKLLQQTKLTNNSNVNPSFTTSTSPSSESKQKEGVVVNGDTKNGTLIVPDTLLPDRRLLPLALATNNSSTATVPSSIGTSSNPLKTPSKHVTFDASLGTNIPTSSPPPPPPPISPPRSLLKNYLGATNDREPSSSPSITTNPSKVAKSYRQEMLHSSSIGSSLTTPVTYPNHRDGILTSSSPSTSTGPVLSPTSLSTLNTLDAQSLLAYSSLSDGTAPRAVIPLIHSTGGASALWPSLHGRSTRSSTVSSTVPSSQASRTVATSSSSSSSDRLAQLVGSPLIRATRARVQATHRAGQILDRETARKRIFGALIRWIRRRLPHVRIKVQYLREKRLKAIVIIQRYVRGYRARELRRQLRLKAAQEKAVLARIDKEEKYRIAETYDQRLEIALTVIEAARRFQEGSSTFYTPNTALIEQSLGRTSIDSGNGKNVPLRANSLLSIATDTTVSSSTGSVTIVNGVPVRKTATGNYVPHKPQPLPSFVKLPHSAFTTVMKYTSYGSNDNPSKDEDTIGSTTKNDNGNNSNILDALISQKLQPLMHATPTNPVPSVLASVSPSNTHVPNTSTPAKNSNEPSATTVKATMTTTSTTRTTTATTVEPVRIPMLTKLLKDKQANIGTTTTNTKNSENKDAVRESSTIVNSTARTTDPNNDLDSQRTTTTISTVVPLSSSSPSSPSSSTFPSPTVSTKELIDKLPAIPKLAPIDGDGRTFEEKRLIDQKKQQQQQQFDQHLLTVKTSIAAAALSSTNGEHTVSNDTVPSLSSGTSGVAKVIPAPVPLKSNDKVTVTTDSLIDSILDGIEAEALTGGTLEERLSRAFTNNTGSN